MLKYLLKRFLAPWRRHNEIHGALVAKLQQEHQARIDPYIGRTVIMDGRSAAITEYKGKARMRGEL